MSDSLAWDWTRPVSGTDKPKGGSAMAPFVQVFLERQADLTRIVAAMGFGAADGEDILQDVFLEASERPGEYRGRGEARRWLMRVTVNRCLLEFRRRQRFRKSAEEILARQAPAQGQDPGTGPDECLARAESVERIRFALHGLHESLLTPVVLRYFVGLDSSEIGDVLGLAASTVRCRLRDGRMALANRLSRSGAES